MAHRLFILPVLLIFAAAAAAQTLDNEKLRKAAYLPYITLTFEFNSDGLDERGKKIASASKIRALTDQLQNNSDDAALYLDIAELHAGLKQNEDRDRALAKAEPILHSFLDTQDPKKGFMISLYARLLALKTPNHLDGAVKWARRAVAVSPDDWRCWAALGNQITAHTFAALRGRHKDTLSEPCKTSEQLGERLLRASIPSEGWQAIKNQLDEARACFERARRIAPNEIRLLDEYCIFRAWEHPCRWAMQQLEGRATLPQNPIADRDIAQFHQELARRQPENLAAQFKAAFGIAMQSAHRASGACPALTALPRDDATTLELISQRFEKAMQDQDREIAAFASGCLFYLASAMGEKDRALRTGHCALKIDPTNQDISLLCESMYREDNRWTEAHALAVGRLEAVPNSRNCFLAAKSAIERGMPVNAENFLRRGITMDSTDLHCQLGLAAVLLRSSDRREALEEAGKWLAKVNERCGSQDESFQVDLEANRALYHALRGDNADEAKKRLRQRAIEHPDWERLQEVASALEIDVPRQPIDKQKLVQAARPPESHFNQVQFLDGVVHVRILTGADVNTEIANLRKRLHRQPEDALSYWKMAILQGDSGEIEESKQSMNAALGQFPALVSRDPANPLHATLYASALLRNGKIADADIQIKAIKWAESADWRVWTSLAEYACNRVFYLLSGPKAQDSKESADVLGQPSLRCLQIADEILHVAESHFQRAAILAPDEPGVWRAGYRFHSRQAELNRSIQVMRTGSDLGRAQQEKFAGLVLNDLQELCRFCPDDPDVRCYLAGIVFGTNGSRPNYRAELEGHATHLEKIAQTSGRDIAGHCHLCAAYCWWLLQDYARGAKCAQKALDLAPSDPHAWSMLLELLYQELRFGEAADLMEKRVIQHPDATTFYLLAELAFDTPRRDKAEAYFRAGLKVAENDLNCTFGMATIALHRGDSPSHLAEAERWLQKAETILAGQKNANHLLLTGILRGLQGDALASQLYLREAQTLDPGNANIKIALQAVSP